LKYPGYKYFYAVSDFLILSFSFIISNGLYNIFYKSKPFGFFSLNGEEFALLLASNIVFILIFQYFHLYKINVFLTRSAQMITIIKSMLYGVIFIIVISFFLKIPIISDSRLFIAIYFNVAAGLMFIFRVILLSYVYKKHLGTNLFRRRVVIVGTGKTAMILAQKISFENSIGVEVVGFVDDILPYGSRIFKNLKVISGLNDIESLKEKINFNEIIICLDRADHEHLLQIIDRCMKLNVVVKVTSGLFGVIEERIFSEQYHEIPVIDISTKIHFGMYAVIKRIFDFFGGFSGLLILSPFFLIIGLIIKLTSRGPVIFKQIRIGKDGKKFDFYKFRSMKVIKGEDHKRASDMISFMKSKNKDGSSKIINESRITGIGKFLRKYSLDELPQLLNVLRGEMSLVGPRPCLPYEYEHYDSWQKRRLSVLPGCTGLWQVTARSEVNFNDSVIIDLYYISNISPWLDLQLILKTVPVMLFARGGK
jgi:exopolysaccharide biosynthesis polyprenyl glycosylphosphotransferase